MPQFISPAINVEQPALIAQVVANSALTAATVSTAAATDLATAVALANALKTAVNALIVDITAGRVNSALARTQGNALASAMVTLGQIAAA